jgi:hypothetical protein
MRRLAGVPGLKPRVAGALGEERAERLVLVAQRLLQRHRGHLGQKRQIRVLLQPNVRFSTACYAWSGYARHRYAVLTIPGCRS